MIKAILMDFNGVIINDEPIQMKAYQEVLKGDGIDLTDADYYSSLGTDDRSFTLNAFKRAGKSVSDSKVDEIVAAKSAKWREMVDGELPFFDGIENFIEKMSRVFSLGIVSMASRHEIEYVLEKGGLAHHFDVLISAEDVAKCKPDPECFRLGFAQLDAARTSAGHLPMAHSECLVIEDSPPGVISATTAGLQALGVTNTVSAKDLRDAGAAAVANDLNDWMPESIRRIFV
jgi:HAD superfamily hydrolase (TIGR01509 family)